MTCRITVRPRWQKTLRSSCRLCGLEYIETRQHLLTNRQAREHERQQYRKSLRRISVKKKLLELQSLTDNSKWVVILVSGTVREQSADPINNRRILKTISPITQGESFSPAKHKKIPSCAYAWTQAVNTWQSCPLWHIRIYTNRGHSPGNKSTGFGIRIVKHEHGREHVILMLSDGLGSTAISETELMAI